MRPTEYEPVTPEGPGFHPFLVLWGLAMRIAYFISRARLFFLPLNLVLGAAAIALLITNSGSYQEAAQVRQSPQSASIDQVARGVAQGYVRVTGSRGREARYGFTVNGKVVERWYPLIDKPYVLMVRGENLPESGPYTGLLRPMEPELKPLIMADAMDPENRDLSFIKEQYLDAKYTPDSPQRYLRSGIWLGVAAVLLLVPPLFGYRLFRRGTAREPVRSGGPPWPVAVRASGWFTKETGQKRYEAFTNASLVRTGSAEAPLQVRFERVERRGVFTWVHSIPADREAEWGYAYGTGRPLPAVSFGSGAKRVVVAVPSETVARQIVTLFETRQLQ